MINQKYRILLTLSHLKKDALINSTAFLTFYNRKFNLIPHKKIGTLCISDQTGSFRNK